MTADELAAFVKAWRGKALSAREAAELFGVPQRTWQHMEQGRGFPYPQLLIAALTTVDPKEGKDGQAS
jgi:Helix-turn-helix domain